MCAIVGSFDTDKLKELAKLNLYRGNHTHSLSLFNTQTGNISILKKDGPLDVDNINIPVNHYGIVHVQAPTSKVQEHLPIHPAIHKDSEQLSALWHNGIIKDNKLAALRDSLSYIPEESWYLEWDTHLILLKLLDNGTPDEFVDGSFSCLWYNDRSLFLFRNEISPMFIDENMNISSTKFENSSATQPNIMFKLDLVNKRLLKRAEFKTKENPYFFID